MCVCRKKGGVKERERSKREGDGGNRQTDLSSPSHMRAYCIFLCEAKQWVVNTYMVFSSARAGRDRDRRDIGTWDTDMAFDAFSACLVEQGLRVVRGRVQRSCSEHAPKSECLLFRCFQT